jgi:putative phage-type endonuclease
MKTNAAAVLPTPVHPVKRANRYKQNTKDWYAWRNKGLGASNLPAVMGESPWTTPFQLWAEMTGLLPRQERNSFAVAAMERGKLLEPAVRQWYTFKTGLVLEADVNCEHPVHEFLRASLDGWRDEDCIVREIKCPGKEDHAKALKGRVPSKYYPQVQAQLMVTGGVSAEYVSFDGADGVIVPVPRDEEYIKSLETAGVNFWHMVQTEQPPKPTARDLKALVATVSGMSDRLNKHMATLSLVTKLLS